MSKKSRSKVKSRMISLIVFVLLACLAVYIYHGLQTPLTVTTYNYHNKKIPSAFSDYTIVQISDLHCKNFGKNQSELISKIKAAKPDMIALTGDIVDEDHDSISSVEDLLKGIKDLAPIYFVTGNHELTSLAATQYQELLALFQKYGVTDLDNDSVKLKKDGQSITLYGRQYFSQYLTDSLPIASDKDFDILLYHGSDNFKEIAPYHYDLILSGHAHGGIVRLPIWGGIFGNDGTFFPEYAGGEYTIGDATLISSRGLGDASIPRFNNPPELVVIKLNP